MKPPCPRTSPDPARARPTGRNSLQATKSLTNVAASLADELLDHGFSPFYGTPCGILAPLYAALEDKSDLLTVPREDTAIGVAAGAAAAGQLPVVLMQNSGLGQSVNAAASAGSIPRHRPPR
jgi:sulfopyruvate decarboxylase TPP-binding subunit